MIKHKIDNKGNIVCSCGNPANFWEMKTWRLSVDTRKKSLPVNGYCLKCGKILFCNIK